MIKRIASGITAFLLSITSLFVFAPNIASAATRTWDGSAGDGKFSTAENWSDDTVPANGDSVVFPVSAAPTSDTSITQDISGLSLASLSVTGDTGSECGGLYPRYNITGAALTVTSSIDSSAASGICWYGFSIRVLNLTLSGSTVTLANPAPQSGPSIALGGNESETMLTLGTTNVNVTGSISSIGSNIVGSGTITAAKGLGLYGDNSSYTGNIVTTSGMFYIGSATSLGSGGSPVVIGDGVSLYISKSITPMAIARPITLAGGTAEGSWAKLTFSNSQTCSNAADVTLSGAFTLEADAQYSSGCPSKLIIQNPVLNGHAFTASENNAGTVVLGNEEITPEWEEITITDDKPEEPLFVGAYKIVIFNGVREQVQVQTGGVLKGTGRTTGQLYAAPGSVVAPGLSPGCLTVGINLSMYGEYQFEAKGATACSEHDQIKVTGTVSLTQPDGDDPKSGTLKVSFLDDYNPAAGAKFVIIDNDGTDAVEGTFNGLAEGATFEGPNGSVLKISYVGGDGNDVEITVITAGTPDTGFGMLLNNPALTAGLTALAAGAILIMARRMKPAVKRARR